MSFSECLKNARKRAGLKQIEVAAAIGVAKSTYSLYESGRNEPDIEKIKKIASVLQTSPSVLLELPTAPPPPPAKWNKLDSEDRKTVERLIEAMLQAPKYRALFQPDKIREA